MMMVMELLVSERRRAGLVQIIDKEEVVVSNSILLNTPRGSCSLIYY
jgi:hypothetical protein